MAKVIVKVIEQHAAEAAFVWFLRDRAVASPQYRVADLKRIDNRIEAHLDGLRIAGEAGWEIAWKQAEETPEPGSLFVIGVLAFESGLPERINQVLSMAMQKPAFGRAVTSGIGWLPAAIATSRLTTIVSHPSPQVRRIGLAGYAVHRLNPGTALEKALGDADFDLRARALKMVGEMGYIAWLPLLKKQLSIAHLPCRFQAARSAALLAGDAAAIAELQTIALIESGYRQRAVEIVVRRLDIAAAHRWLAMLNSLPGGERLAIQGMGIVGDPASISRILEAMAKPALARVAGEAFTFITGCYPGDQNLEGRRPEGFDAGPNEDALDENVAMDPDEGLPWPDPVKIERWWATNQNRFVKGVRHLAGRPISTESLHDIIATQRQRLRLAAAFELLIRNPKQLMFEARARNR